MNENTNQPSEEEAFTAEMVDDQGEAPTAEDLGLDLPEDPERAIEFLLVKVAEARDEATSYLDDLKRVAADFENFRRRALKEQGETTQRAAERILIELLPALDSFDAALSVEASTESEEKVMAGMHRTHEQLLNALRTHGLEIVSTVGEAFDPEVHEAVMSPAGEGGRLVVSEELRRGYTLKGRLVRPALVAVDHEDAGTRE